MPPNNTIIQTLWNLYTRAVSVDARNGRSKSRGPRSSTMKVEEEPNTSVQNLKLAAGKEYRQRSKRQASSSPLSKPKVHRGTTRVQLIPL